MNGLLRAGWIALILSLGMISKAEATDLSGQLAGRWNSFNTGHTGPLRCRLTKLDETRYQADFRARSGWKA